MSVSNKSDPVVTVCCLTYNHSKYIEQAIRSFFDQVTTFPIEVYVHDDASTDGTQEILRRLQQEFSNLHVIYEERNRYRETGGWYFDSMIFPIAKGEYLAFCEGDDYWIDRDKLQKQYVALSKHPECAMCAHASKVIDGRTGEARGVLGMGTEEKILSPEKIILGWALPTASFFMRKEAIIDFRKDWSFRMPVGDFTRALYLALQGGVYYLPDQMSAYRFLTDGSWSTANRVDANSLVNSSVEWLVMLDKIDEVTQGAYTSVLEESARNKVIQIAKTGSDKWKESRLGVRAYESQAVSKSPIYILLRLLWIMGFDLVRSGWGDGLNWRLARR